MVFDLLRLDGGDLTAEPLESAASLLAGLGLDGVAGRCPRRTTTAQMLLDATLQQGLEGIVSKRRTSRTARGSAARTG